MTECNQGPELVDFKMGDDLGRPLELESFLRQVTEEEIRETWNIIGPDILLLA